MAFSKIILNGTTLMDVTDKTVTSASMLDGVTSLKNDGTSITGTIANGSATTPATSITANPTISVNSSTGVITASVSATQSITPTVSAGYVASGTAGTVTVSGSNTSNLTTQGAQTITPTTSDQTIATGKYLTGTQTIKGDANLVASNIKKDVGIFGVTGTYEGGGGGGSSYTLVASAEITVSTTTTSRTNQTTVQLPSGDFDSLYFITIRDKAGKRNGYYYGTDNFYILADTNIFYGGVCYHVSNDGSLLTVRQTTASRVYGLCAYSLSSHSVQITSQYNETNSGTINGTFDIKVYKLDYPNNLDPRS